MLPDQRRAIRKYREAFNVLFDEQYELAGLMGLPRFQPFKRMVKARIGVDEYAPGKHGGFIGLGAHFN